MSGVEQRARQVAKQLLHGLGRASAEQAAVLERLARDVATLNARLDRVVEELRTELGVRAAPARSAPSAPEAAPPVFRHEVPTFDQLVRAAEDRHRSSNEEVAAGLRDDYLELLAGAGAEDLPLVDLGCGRGELVAVLTEAGVPVLGVGPDRVPDPPPDGVVVADPLGWLDSRPGSSVRSVVVRHAVGRLSADLQVRVVFEAHRVTAPGGLLVVEVPDPNGAPAPVDAVPVEPVRPGLVEFLMSEAGFTEVEVRTLRRPAVVAVVARR